jgi:hypothetical protein
VAELYKINVPGRYIKFEGYFKQPLIYCAANYTAKTKYTINIVRLVEKGQLVSYAYIASNLSLEILSYLTNRTKTN